MVAIKSICEHMGSYPIDQSKSDAHLYGVSQIVRGSTNFKRGEKNLQTEETRSNTMKTYKNVYFSVVTLYFYFCES